MGFLSLYRVSFVKWTYYSIMSRGHVVAQSGEASIRASKSKLLVRGAPRPTIPPGQVYCFQICLDSIKHRLVDWLATARHCADQIRIQIASTISVESWCIRVLPSSVCVLANEIRSLLRIIHAKDLLGHMRSEIVVVWRWGVMPLKRTRPYIYILPKKLAA